MIKTIAAVSVAALIAGVITFLPGVSPTVEASTPQAGVKADRLDLRPRGAACSQRGWPHYERACLRDASRNAGQARTVRVVSSDRLTDAPKARTGK